MLEHTVHNLEPSRAASPGGVDLGVTMGDEA